MTKRLLRGSRGPERLRFGDDDYGLIDGDAIPAMLALKPLHMPTIRSGGTVPSGQTSRRGGGELRASDLLEPGDAHRLGYVVNHVKGLLIVVEVKGNRRLVRQPVARGRHVLDQGASHGSERSLGRAFKLLEVVP